MTGQNEKSDKSNDEINSEEEIKLMEGPVVTLFFLSLTAISRS